MCWDKYFSEHHTPAMYGFQSYISMPIIKKDGTFFGTLCAIDPKPAKLDNIETIGMFKMFAELIAFHLQAIEEIQLAELKLNEEQEISELREQFIAILGHDLRNPLGAISSSAQLLQRMNLSERANRLAHIIKDSSYRMNGLIENILDFARGRLGEGITLQYDQLDEQSITQVITELQSIWPDRQIETRIDITEPVSCDSRRIAQLLSNLLGNALTHGDADQPVNVQSYICTGDLVIQVSNGGIKIPEDIMAKLFQPFSRNLGDGHAGGLGLGLFISSEIARAHGGTLTAESQDEATVLTLRIPVNGSLTN